MLLPQKHNKRYFSKTLFKRKLANGKTVPAEILLYSPLQRTVFCFAHILSGDNELQSEFTASHSELKNAAAHYLTVNVNIGTRF